MNAIQTILQNLFSDNSAIDNNIELAFNIVEHRVKLLRKLNYPNDKHGHTKSIATWTRDIAKDFDHRLDERDLNNIKRRLRSELNAKITLPEINNHLSSYKGYKKIDTNEYYIELDKTSYDIMIAVNARFLLKCKWNDRRIYSEIYERIFNKY